MGVVNGSFVATGNSATVDGQNVDLIVGGTFVGTVQLQVAIPDATGANIWVPVGANITAPGVVTLLGAMGRKFRAACTAFTSGTIFFSLGASTCEDAIY